MIELKEKKAWPPVEVLLEAVLGTDVGTEEQKHMLPFRVIVQKDGDGVPITWEASVPSRGIVWCDNNSMERAIAAMIHGVAMLARDGSLDPNEPNRIGVPPIQHVMNILSDRLAWHVARRRESCDDLTSARTIASESKGQAMTIGDGLGRQSDVISALGTAISALARIKDL